MTPREILDELIKSEEKSLASLEKQLGEIHPQTSTQFSFTEGAIASKKNSLKKLRVGIENL